MAKTRPTSEQVRFRSAATGEHILDTYMEAAERGGRTLPDLLSDMWTDGGIIRTDIFEWRVTSTNSLQVRTGDYVDPEAGWVNVSGFFKDRGTFSAAATYSNFDVVTLSDTSVYLIRGLTSATQYANEAALISAGHLKLIDITVLNAAVASAQLAQAAAETAQAAAETAETNAATSASNASTYASSAAASATTASTKATDAAGSATTAANEATVAAASASTAGTHATNAAASLASTQAVYDSFDDRYLGPKAAEPSTDNDGNALLTGALFFNTTATTMMVWTGAIWLSTFYDPTNVAITGGTINNVTYAGNTIWHSGNDGAGSTLDADTVDGLQASQFLRSDASDTTTGSLTASRFQSTNTTGGGQDATTDFANGMYVEDAQVWTSSHADFDFGAGFTAKASDIRGFNLLVNATGVFARRLHSTNMGSWMKLWTDLNHGSGSGLDADLLDGNHASAFVLNGATASQIAINTQGVDFILQDTTNAGVTNYLWRDHSAGKLFIGTAEDVPTTRADLVTDGGDTYWHSGNDGAGSGLDADKLDGLNSTNFARVGTTGANTNTYIHVARNSTNSTLYVNNYSTGEIARFFKGTAGSDTSGTDMLRILNDASLTTTGYLEGSNLKVKNNNTGTIAIQKDTATQYSGVTWTIGGNEAWLWHSSNNGSGDFSIQNRDWTAGGAYMSTPFRLEHSTGKLFLAGGLEITSGGLTVANATHSITGNLTLTGDLTLGNATDYIAARELRTVGGTQLVLAAGEAYTVMNHADMNAEKVYSVSEGGFTVFSSPDNWASGWAGRNEATICNNNGDSFFPAAVVATGYVQSAIGYNFTAPIALRVASGNYASISVAGSRGGWTGYSISNTANFMYDGSSQFGLYDDGNNKWVLKHIQNSSTSLYYNGSEVFRSQSYGAAIYGDLRATGHLFSGGNSDTNPAANNVNGAVIQSSGLASFAVSSAPALYVGRNSTDGDIVRFYQAGVQEGVISVSGTTVSYNGGHLSRWSQLPAAFAAQQATLLKGTVMTNLDEMAEWIDPNTALPEDNEQLNRMKISDVVGDPDVAGVFVALDEDHDMIVAMTGDMVIRIASGTTVARGDLLISAGDGTATPQVDDVVRSNTIAKVTSTTVTATYADGSYTVPCVLMAC